jgi:RimJ/RimL family protein N-acetyltransferase
VNDPSWLRFIGNKDVRTLDDAQRYIVNGPAKMYARFGFGLWAVELKERGMPVGMCGLIKRDTLEDVDIGFAFLSAHRGNGFAFEAAFATASYGWSTLGLTRIVAITSPDNVASARLLAKLGFRLERTTRLAGEASDVHLYAADRAGDDVPVGTHAPTSVSLVQETTR